MSTHFFFFGVLHTLRILVHGLRKGRIERREEVLADRLFTKLRLIHRPLRIGFLLLSLFDLYLFYVKIEALTSFANHDGGENREKERERKGQALLDSANRLPQILYHESDCGEEDRGRGEVADRQGGFLPQRSWDSTFAKGARTAR